MARHLGASGSGPELNDGFHFLDERNCGCFPVAQLISARRVALNLRVNNLTDRLFTTFGYFDGSQPVWIVGATRNAYLGVTFDW